KPPTGSQKHHLDKLGSIVTQTLVSIYVGYYGGGLGFFTLGGLTLAGMALRSADSGENLFVGGAHASTRVVFCFFSVVGLLKALVLVIASEISSHLVGVRLLNVLNERTLRIGVIALGLMLSLWLFVKL